MASVRITGLRETQRNLSAVGVEADELKAAMRAGSEILADNLRQETPVRTGALAATVRPGTAKSKAIARIGRARPRHYAPFVDFGTKYIKARRFSSTALAKSVRPALAAIQADLQRIIRKHGF